MKPGNRKRTGVFKDGHQWTPEKLVFYEDGKIRTLFRRSGAETDYRPTDYEIHLQQSGIPDSDEAWRSYCASYVTESILDQVKRNVTALRAIGPEGNAFSVGPVTGTFTLPPVFQPASDISSNERTIRELNKPEGENHADLDTSPLFDSAGNRAYQFRRHQKTWSIVFDGVHSSIPHRIGLKYIHVLLGRPNQFVSATYLVDSLNSQSWPSPSLGITKTELGDGFEAKPSGIDVFDKEELKRLRSSIKEIDEQIKELEPTANHEEIERLKVQKDALITYVKKGINKFGKPRKIGLKSESDRKSVRHAIVRALEAIDESNPNCSDFLRKHIKTGSSCCYHSGRVISWHL
jgi:hypothetical protein